MKMFYRSAIIFGMLGQILYADALSDKKAELERQIAELEAKQNEQKEVEELERRLQQLQTKADQELSGQTPRQQTAPQQTYPAQTTVQNPNSSGVITQEMRDAEVKNIFGKNRNGVLLGIGIGSVKIDYLSSTTSFNENFVTGNARIGYQRFPNNKVFGGRIYLDSFVGAGTFKDGATTMQIFTALNADILMDFNIPNTYSYVGLFIGGGFGSFGFNYTPASIWENLTTLTGGSGFINFGAAITLNAKHRLEFYAKKPTTNKYDDKFHWQTSTLLNMVYQYTF
ncbi:hypothetical protein [Helicobacter sp. MIT 05-5293]|uniref:hypothetical protein n=1 Tax=Helicobacter sp. MIT 05-5293 TaxID=1548149 RepID=UPI0013153C97|nr:hypothetical protein [Helicobacter sp. MIT 05-5293]